jgi:hypothetical protein
MVESNFLKNLHLALYPTAAGVHAAVGHNIKGDANGRLYCGRARFLPPWGTATRTLASRPTATRVQASCPTAAAP